VDQYEAYQSLTLLRETIPAACRHALGGQVGPHLLGLLGLLAGSFERLGSGPDPDEAADREARRAALTAAREAAPAPGPDAGAGLLALSAALFSLGRLGDIRDRLAAALAALDGGNSA
jgi:hypothetical protein